MKACPRCGRTIADDYEATLCRGCDPLGGNCVSCREPVRRHRTRAGRWVGCRAAALRIVQQETVTTEMQAIAARVTDAAPRFDLPFALTAQIVRPRAIQPGLFGGLKDE